MTAPRAPRRGGRWGGAAPTWRDRISALRYVPPFMRMVWETHRGYTTATALLRLVRAFVPVASLWIGKLIIDAVVAARQGGADWGRLLRLVGLELGVVVAGDVLGRISQLIDGALADLFTNRVSVRLMEHAATLDLAQFEDPAFYDHLERARQSTTGRTGLLSQVFGIAQQVLTVLSLSAALLAFNAWLFALLALATIPSFAGETHFAALQYSLFFRRTPQRRQLDYVRYVGASAATAKEVQLFGLAPWLIDRYRRLSDAFYSENRRLALWRAAVGAASSLVATLAYYGAYLIILLRTVRGETTVGSLTFLAGSFMRSRDIIQGMLMDVSGIGEQALYVKDLFAFFDIRPTIASRPGAPPVPAPIREGFVFEDVGFRYEGSEQWALRHVSLRLRPGERVALVGENGAGKTTLAKLLARLYDPSEGRILLDGVDLRDYDLASLRRAIGVIFQDFVRYDMRFDENVGVGEVDAVRGYLDAGNGDGRTPEPSPTAAGPPPPEIVSAAERSLAATLLPRFRAGYRQMLGRRFEDGVDLSGGEWQKIALARAYMREAQVLILDEPTAALDARAEYEVFLRFSELMAGRMAVLISHRFSTVRMADRIVVLRHGEVVEQGTHEELVASGGLYGELFAMQAAGYR